MARPAGDAPRWRAVVELQAGEADASESDEDVWARLAKGRADGAKLAGAKKGMKLLNRRSEAA